MSKLKYYQKLWKETEDSSFMREMFAAQHLFEPWTKAKNIVWNSSKQELKFNAAHFNQDDVKWILKVTGLRTYKIDVEDGMLRIRIGI